MMMIVSVLGMSLLFAVYAVIRTNRLTQRVEKLEKQLRKTDVRDEHRNEEKTKVTVFG